MNDSTHPMRTLLMRQTLTLDDFPAVWAYGINEGFGYPLFHFYAPLFHTLTGTFSFFITPITSSIKLVLLLIMLFGTLGVMFYAKKWGKLSAIFAGSIFALSPYLALDLYVRGAYSELLSICLLPWVLLATENIRSIRRICLAAVAISLFVLSHNLLPIVVLPMILIWGIYHNGLRSKGFWSAIALSFILSAWYIMPLVFERHFTLADQIARTTDYALHFVEPWQLWNSTWGFGGSAPGVEDGLSFKIGKVQILLGLAGILIAILRKNKKMLMMTGFLIFSLFLCLSYSRWLWELSPVLQLLQFPWRTLGITALLLSLLAGFSLTFIPSKLLRITAVIISIFALFFFNYQYFAPQSISQTPVDKPDFVYEPAYDIASVVPEYRPVWWNRTTELASSFPAGTLTTQGYEYQLAGNDQPVSLGISYYPTWQAKIDDVDTILTPDTNGLVSLVIPAGIHQVRIYQSHTLLENIASLISLLAVLLIIYLWKYKNVKI